MYEACGDELPTRLRYRKPTLDFSADHAEVETSRCINVQKTGPFQWWKDSSNLINHKHLSVKGGGGGGVTKAHILGE